MATNRELIGKIALCSLTVGAIVTGNPVAVIGGVGANILSSNLDSYWSIFCQHLYQPTGLAADPLDKAMHVAIERALDRLKRDYQGPRGKLTQFFAADDETDKAFTVFETLLLTRLDNDDVLGLVQQDDRLAAPGNRETTRAVFSQFVESHFGQQRVDENEWTPRHELGHFLERHLPDAVALEFQAYINTDDADGRTASRALSRILQAAALDVLQAMRDEFNRAQLSKARLVSVKNLNWGTTGPHVDILVAEYDPQKEVTLPHWEDALARFRKHKTLVIVAKPLAGKTHLAGRLLEELPDDTTVVIPKSWESPPSFEILRGSTVALFVDDFHVRARMFDPTFWWDALSSISPSCYLLVTSRSTPEWETVRDRAEPFLDRIHPEAVFHLDDMPIHQGAHLADSLALDDQWRNRWDGTIGSLRLDFTKMGRRFFQLDRESYGKSTGGTLLRAAKVLHSLRQPMLEDRLLHDVAEQIHGVELVPYAWQTLLQRTRDFGFGNFDEARSFRIYNPYLEKDDVIPYDPKDDQAKVAELILETKNAVSIFYLGVWAQIDKGDKKLATTAYLQGIALGEGTAAFNLGVLLEEQGDIPGAIAAYRQGITLGKGGAASNLGVLLEEQGDIPGAIAAYRQGITLRFPDSAYNLGVLLQQQGDIPGAISAYRQGIDTYHGGSASNLGVLLQMQGDMSGAIAAFHQGIERGFGGAASNLGLLLLKQGDTPGAIAAFKQGIDLGESAAALNLGSFLEQDGELPGAIAAFQRAIAMGQSAATLHLGMLYQDQDDISAAIATFEQGIDMGEGAAAFNLAVLLERQGNISDAVAAYNLGIALDYGGAASNLGVLLLKQGDIPGAIAAFEQGMDMGEGAAAANLGIVLWNEGRIIESLVAFRHGIELRSDTAAKTFWGLFVNGESKHDLLETLRYTERSGGNVQEALGTLLYGIVFGVN